MATLGLWVTGLLVVIVCLLILLYLYSTWNFGVFKKMGIKGPKPRIFFGNHMTIAKKGFTEADMEWWREYGDVFGYFSGPTPMLVVADTGMLQEILVKQFNNFTDRASPRGISGIMEENLSLQKGAVWKSSRSILTPTFTSGKLRKMDPLINEAADALIAHIKKNTNESNEVNFAWLFGCYTLDVIASTAFGIKIDSQRDPNDIFVRMAAKVLAVKLSSPYLTLAFIFPALMKPFSKLFDISVLDPEASDFFKQQTEKIINSRETIQQEYADFVQLMMEAHNDNPEDNGSRRGLTSKEIISNSVLFFFAGYETTSATLSFFTYFLALHQDVQQKLYEEIVTELGEEEPGYNNVGKLQYMDMCLKEAMRLYPASSRTDRTCVRDTEVNGLKIPKDMQIAIPIWVLHHSDKLWEDPEKFDPERFSPENQAKMNPYQYMPFGFGPRICIGKRLAITEMKVAIIKLLKEFVVLKCNKTKIPPKMLSSGLNKPEDMWMKVELRN
ncbi:cytochrome P450 3A24-like [Crassostrea virginica]